jgi:hypothetical protein
MLGGRLRRMRSKMKKYIFVLILYVTVGNSVFAQKYDYKEVLFGNNYKQIQEIDGKENNEILSKLEGFLNQNNEFKYDINSTNTRIFSENCTRQEDARVYRIIYNISNNEQDFSDYKEWKYLSQAVFIQLGNQSKDFRLIYYSPFYLYDIYERSHSNDEEIFSGLEVIYDKNKNIIGVLTHKTISPSNGKKYSYAQFYTWNQIINDESYYNTSGLKVLDTSCNKYEIYASGALLDSKRPFKYSIQNAFDGNPSTSFVENTDDNLMYLYLKNPINKMEPEIMCDKISIINGYAENKTLYSDNNRIRLINSQYFGAELHDNMMDRQEVPSITADLDVESVYPGRKYSDTCLAELDFFINGKWIFSER